jgi:hypothetical protein
MYKRHLLTLALTLCITSTAVLAQDGAHTVAVDAAARTAVIASLSEKLRSNYVFPDVAKKLSAALIAKNVHGGYGMATNTDSFSDALSSDLRDLGKDGHFRVAYAPGAHPQKAELQETLRKVESSVVDVPNYAAHH